MFTGRPGRRVSREQTVEDVAAIVGGEYDARPERDLYMIGGLDELRAGAAGS
jgi:F0F1-type ATP synthase beta subunit